MPTAAPRRGALAGVRVLDFSHQAAGPWATSLLGDMGADVVKIEKPGRGDSIRYADRSGRLPPEVGGLNFQGLNRNKRGITIDIGTDAGVALVRRLAKDADVVVENFRPGVMDRHGIGYADLSAINPRLVYCSISGFGQSGPYANRPGYDFLIQGLGGLMSLSGRPEGEAGAGPMKVGVALIDLLAGLYACTAILAALAHRDRTGEGQHIDISLLDVGVACLANQALNYCTTGISPVRLGNAHPSIVPYEDFPTADGYMLLGIGNDGQFERFCAEAGRPELARDPRFATNAERVRNRKTLIPLLRQITVTRATAAWVAALEAKSVPCGPINDLAGVFADPQVRSRELQTSVEHPTLGPVPQVASPLRLSGSPVSYRRAPPLLGEHTESVLREVLGLDADGIDALRTRGVL